MADRKTALTMGLLSVPVRVVGASKEDNESDLKTLCCGEGTAHKPVRVKQKYVCPSCGHERSSYHGWPRGTDNGDGTFTPVSAEALNSAQVDSDLKTKIDLVFCPREQVDAYAIPNGKVYYLPPDTAAAAQLYAVLRDVIAAVEEERSAIAIWAYSTAPMYVRLVRMGDLLAIQQLAWPKSIVERPLAPAADYDERLMTTAMMIPDLLTTDFDPETFVDTRKVKIAEAIAAAGPVQGGEADAAVTSVSGARDMVSDLEAWVASKQGKAVSGAVQTAPKKRAARKPAKKAAAPERKSA